MRYFSVPRASVVGEVLMDGSVLDTNDVSVATYVATNVSFAACPVGYQKQCGVFGATSSLTRASLASVQGFMAFVYPTANTKDLMVYVTGTAKISIDGTNNVATTGLSNVTTYVNGAAGTLLTLNAWNLVVVAHDAVTAANFSFGALSFTGNAAALRVFNAKPSANDVLRFWHEFNRRLAGGSDYGAFVPAPKYAGVSPQFDDASNGVSTVTGSPSSANDLFGIATARGYNGSNNSDQEVISIASGSSVTYMCMVNGDGAPANIAPGPSYEYAFPMVSGTGGASSAGISWNYTSGFPGRIGAAFVNPSGTPYYASFGTLSGSTWYCLAFVFNQSANTIRTYRDGVFQNQASTSGTLALSAYALFGGNGGALSGFPGKVGQWAIWDSALSDNQIAFASAAMRSGRYPYAFRRSIPLAIQRKAKFYAPDGRYNIAQSGYDLSVTGTPSTFRAFQNSGIKTSAVGSYYSNSSAVPSCALTSGGSYTMACWIKSSDTTGTEYYLYYGDNTAPLNICILLLSGVIQADWSRSNVADDLTSTGLAPDGKWHHVAATFSGGVTKVYLDGYLKTTGSYTQSVGTGVNGGPGNGVSVARNFDAEVNVSDCFIADSALTGNEIQHLYYSTYRN